jgi:hypothetical protein
MHATLPSLHLSIERYNTVAQWVHTQRHLLEVTVPPTE